MNNYSQFKERFFQLYKPADTIANPYIILYNGKILIAPNNKYIWQSLGAAKGAITKNFMQRVFGVSFKMDDIGGFVNQMIEDGIIEFVPVEMMDDSQES